MLIIAFISADIGRPSKLRCGYVSLTFQLRSSLCRRSIGYLPSARFPHVPVAQALESTFDPLRTFAKCLLSGIKMITDAPRPIKGWARSAVLRGGVRLAFAPLTYHQ